MLLYNQEIEVQSGFYKGQKGTIVKQERKQIGDSLSGFKLISLYHLYIPELLETIVILENDLLTDEQKITAEAEKEQPQPQEKESNTTKNPKKKRSKTGPVVRG